MKRFTKALRDTDLFLLTRVFMRIAHWIDWRFHVNQYDQGAMFLSVGLAMNFALNIQSLIRHPWIGVLGTFGSVLLIWVYSWWLKKLAIASKKYEKHPDRIYPEQAFFMILLMPPLRLVMLTLGVMLILTPSLHGTIIDRIGDCWMSAMGAGLYLAGGLPPSRPRREKKGWAWRQLQGAATPA